MQRGEGVALVLAGPDIAAWNAGGQQWESWGSRIVRATLSAGEKPREKLHLFSCYAPTFAAGT